MRGTFSFLTFFLVAGCALFEKEAPVENSFRAHDFRNASNAHTIARNGYADQPYILQLPDGRLFCTLTTSIAHEGSTGQSIAYTHSMDKGVTWSEIQFLESTEGPEASWVVPFLNEFGRIYIFYTYNGDNVNLDDRNDTVGWYVFRFSDDNGNTWSKRYRIPVPITHFDRANILGGKSQFFWGIDKPQKSSRGIFWGFSKVENQYLSSTEGWVWHSPNLHSEPHPDSVIFDMLPPESDISSFTSPGNGKVAEEHNLVHLDDSRLYVVYRTAEGKIAESYSLDREGTEWSKPKFIQYKNGETIRNPRACPMLFKIEDGGYLLWFHNNGRGDGEGRNPVWISIGREKNGIIEWEYPEILIYDETPNVRMSYPDLNIIEGDFYFSYTDKSTAKFQKIPSEYITKILRNSVEIADEYLVFEDSSELNTIPQKLSLLFFLKVRGLC